MLPGWENTPDTWYRLKISFFHPPALHIPSDFSNRGSPTQAMSRRCPVIEGAEPWFGLEGRKGTRPGDGSKKTGRRWVLCGGDARGWVEPEDAAGRTCPVLSLPTLSTPSATPPILPSATTPDRPGSCRRLAPSKMSIFLSPFLRSDEPRKREDL